MSRGARDLLREADALIAEAESYEAIDKAVCHAVHPWALVWEDKRSVSIPEPVLDLWLAKVAEMALELRSQAAALEAHVQVKP
jgi:hypothetical protein